MESDTPVATRPGQIVRRSAEQRRRHIVATARTLFAAQGFHNTGMAQIARESTVLVGQIYRDFAGKEDLIAAIVEQDIAEILDDPNLTEAGDASDADRLRTWIHAFIARRPTEESRRLFANMVAEAPRNPRVEAIMGAAQRRLRDRLRLALVVLCPGEACAADREALAELIFTLGGAVLHRQICVVGGDHGAIVGKLIRVVDDELDRLTAQASG